MIQLPPQFHTAQQQLVDFLNTHINAEAKKAFMNWFRSKAAISHEWTPRDRNAVANYLIELLKFLQEHQHNKQDCLTILVCSGILYLVTSVTDP